MGVGVYTLPPRTSIPQAITGWGYGNFIHVVKTFRRNRRPFKDVPMSDRVVLFLSS
jgi:hypothetical protein